ncbi:S-layer homology domain-containing protein [Desnuesiella massiliensis]|uniref:S-layer homology domain-containing protein n=1 Tax=Desnuesiella massiliensis TaxID=1650662 RepID=UPI0006E1D626|nr:S-layer homology domain-containing protein [Desnuesiella massiliensis]
MKVKKSLLSIVLSFLVLAINFTPLKVLAADKDYSEVVKRMQQLGLLDSSITDYNADITREQFLKAVIEVSSLKEQATSLKGSTIYPDVESNSDFSGYVNIAKDKELMFGMADGYFHPELGVTYAEACTILVKLLGYKDADLSGVWPNNYISKAYDLKLTEDLNFKKKDRLPLWAAAMLFDRLLDTNVKKANATEVDKSFAETNNSFVKYIIFDTYLTNSSLKENQLLTNKGTLSYDSKEKFQPGNTYRLKVKDNTIVKVYGKVKEIKSIFVNSIFDNNVYYSIYRTNFSLALDPNIDYYYHGVKQNYSNLNTLIKSCMTLAFTLKEDGQGYEYAVILDPIYSKPEVVLNFDTNSDKIGDIKLDYYTDIYRNGQKITKQDLEEYDVVYKVAGVNDLNSIILVFNNKVEGNIKAFSPNGPTPSIVQIDNGSYNFSRHMDLTKLSAFQIGDKVSALLGYDGKIVDLQNIKYKVGMDQEVKVLGNSLTSEGLSSNQVVTDLGKYYVIDSMDKLQVGGRYRVAIDGDTIVRVKKLENNLENYSVRSISGSIITYNEGSKTLEPPVLPIYYYNGAKVDYNTALSSIQPCSSLILARDSKGYEYGVIIDPIYGKPIIYDYNNMDSIIGLITYNTLFIYRAGRFFSEIGTLAYKDLVYKVYDLWNKNSYIYINSSKVSGRIDSILPSAINPRNIQVGGVTYNFSKYFDMNKLRVIGINVGSTIILILDIDGKIIDIY